MKFLNLLINSESIVGILFLLMGVLSLPVSIYKFLAFGGKILTISVPRVNDQQVMVGLKLIMLSAGCIIVGLVLILYDEREPKKEYPIDVSDCKSINPIVKYPVLNDMVSSPLEIYGRVDELPLNKQLWIFVSNYEREGVITDIKQLFISENKKWATQLSLIGGASGHQYNIKLLLINKKDYPIVRKLKQEMLQQFPSDLIDYDICTQTDIFWE